MIFVPWLWFFLEQMDISSWNFFRILKTPRSFQLTSIGYLLLDSEVFITYVHPVDASEIWWKKQLRLVVDIPLFKGFFHTFCVYLDPPVGCAPPTWWTPLHWRRWTGSWIRHRCHVRKETITKNSWAPFRSRKRTKLWSDEKGRTSKTLKETRFGAKCWPSNVYFGNLRDESQGPCDLNFESSAIFWCLDVAHDHVHPKTSLHFTNDHEAFHHILQCALSFPNNHRIWILTVPPSHQPIPTISLEHFHAPKALQCPLVHTSTGSLCTRTVVLFWNIVKHLKL